MNLLSILNLSNREKPGCDSGVIFHSLLFSRLAAAGWDCAIASPIPLQVPGVRDVTFEVGSSKYDVRFRFDWDKAASLLISERPDVLFVHQIEQVSSYRSLLETIGSSAKLVTYCHYWPVVETDPLVWDDSLNHGGLANVILMRIVAAAATADVFLVTSSWAGDLLKWAARRFDTKVTAKVAVLPCPADPTLISAEPRRRHGNRRVLYNHRLYKQYGTEFFIDLANSLSSEGFTFVVTDFFTQRNAARRGLEPHVDNYRRILANMPNIEMRGDGDIRSVYRDVIIGGVDIGLAPFRRNANWSMSAVDCMGMGVPVAAPVLGALPEMTPKMLQFSTREEGVSLLRRLANDQAFWEEASSAASQLARSFVADRAVQTLRAYI